MGPFLISDRHLILPGSMINDSHGEKTINRHFQHPEAVCQMISRPLQLRVATMT